MNKIKILASTAFIFALSATPVLAENIGGGSPNSQSLFQQVWTFFFG